MAVAFIQDMLDQDQRSVSPCDRSPNAIGGTLAISGKPVRDGDKT